MGSFIKETHDRIYVYINFLNESLKFNGTIEIDESLFGRKVKAHRGNTHSGTRIWIVGLVERLTNRLILYPVEDRTTRIMRKILERHVEPGCRIFN